MSGRIKQDRAYSLAKLTRPNDAYAALNSVNKEATIRLQINEGIDEKSTIMDSKCPIFIVIWAGIGRLPFASIDWTKNWLSGPQHCRKWDDKDAQFEHAMAVQSHQI